MSTNNIKQNEVISDQVVEEKRSEIPARVESMEPETKNGKIVGARFVNLRQNPSTEARVVVTAAEGDAVKILARDGDWYKVRYGKTKIAYVLTRYCKED